MVKFADLVRFLESFVVILAIIVVVFFIISPIGENSGKNLANVQHFVHKNRLKHKKIVQPPIIHDISIPPVINNIPPLVYRIPTTQPVVFLTIDDGSFKDKSVVDSLANNKIKASLFLAKFFTDSDPEFFKSITAGGSLIEDHTITHNLRMTRWMNRQQQAAEICGMADYEQQTYGRRPVFFRPPGGEYNQNTMLAAGDCGMRAVVTWVAEVRNGVMQYQVGDKLLPGDIVLMHFRPEFKADLDAFISAQNAAGLRTELLEDWL